MVDKKQAIHPVYTYYESTTLLGVGRSNFIVHYNLYDFYMKY